MAADISWEGRPNPAYGEKDHASEWNEDRPDPVDYGERVDRTLAVLGEQSISDLDPTPLEGPARSNQANNSVPK